MTTGTTAQLAVNATTFVALRTYDGQTTSFFHFVGKFDVGTTTCHVCGDSHCTQEAFFFANIARSIVIDALLVLFCALLITKRSTIGGNIGFAQCALTCLRNNLCLLLVKFCIKNLMWDATQVKHTAQKLADLNASGTHEHWTAL